MKAEVLGSIYIKNREGADQVLEGGLLFPS